MLQCILSIAGPEFHLAKQSDKLWVNAVHSDFEQCRFTLFFDHDLYFFLRFFNHFLDSCRMDSSVHDQFLKCNTCNLTSDRIKTGKDHCFRRIINNQIHTCHRLQRADIAAFPTDDTSLHLIARKLHNGNRRFGYMVCRTTLNGVNHIFLCLLVRFFFRPALHFLDQHGCLMLYFVFNNFK